MNIENCIKERRSVRKYKENAIPHEVFEKIVDLARFAPSWKNSQTARYHIIEDADTKEKLASECVMDFEFNAKTIRRSAAVVVLTAVGNICGYEPDGSFSTSKGDRWETFDSGIACQTFCLAAHANGVGSVILGIFDDDKVAKACSIPENETVMALIAVGYPESTSGKVPPRKEVSELLFFDK